jgi:phosphatidylserine decarboxylase
LTRFDAQWSICGSLIYVAMTIHREGRVLLFVLLVVLFAVNWAFAYFLPGHTILQNLTLVASIIFYLIILQFFRNPIFQIQKDDTRVLAPADGKVVVIEETVETEYLKEKRRQVSIFMSPVNVHVNRMPVAGTVSYYKYHIG